MKKIFLLSLLALSFAACADDTKNADSTERERTPQTFETKPQPGAASSDAPTLATSDIAAGKEVYESYCTTCHQLNGQGVPSSFPPLANSDYLNADKERAISNVVHGLAGKITVNGKEYNNIMPPAPRSDREIAQVLTYVFNSWGNSGGVITEADVASRRQAGVKK